MQFQHLTTLLLATLSACAPVPSSSTSTSNLAARQLPTSGGGLPNLNMVSGLLSPVTGTLGGLGGLVKRQIPTTGGLPGLEMVSGLLSPVTGTLGGLGGLVKRQIPGVSLVEGLLGGVTSAVGSTGKTGAL